MKLKKVGAIEQQTTTPLWRVTSSKEDSRNLEKQEKPPSLPVEIVEIQNILNSRRVKYCTPVPTLVEEGIIASFWVGNTSLPEKKDSTGILTTISPNGDKHLLRQIAFLSGQIVTDVKIETERLQSAYHNFHPQVIDSIKNQNS